MANHTVDCPHCGIDMRLHYYHNSDFCHEKKDKIITADMSHFFDKNPSTPTLTPHQHTLPATTVHITKEELKSLLIHTAESKIENGWKFALMSDDKFGGYKLTFIKIDEKIT